MLASAPLLIDFAGDWLGLFSNTFISRATTGSLFGATVAFYLLPGLISAVSQWRGDSAPAKVENGMRQTRTI